MKAPVGLFLFRIRYLRAVFVFFSVFILFEDWILTVIDFTETKKTRKFWLWKYQIAYKENVLTYVLI